MNFSLLLPEMLVAGVAGSLLVSDLLMPRSRPYLAYMGAAGLLGIVAICLVTGPVIGESFGGGILFIDHFTVFFRIAFLLLGVLALLLAEEFAERRLTHPGEYHTLLVVAVLAMMLMAAAGELLTAYLSLELLSFCLYALVSFTREEGRTNEAGMKYILLGALSSAFLLLGISYLYGVLGTTFFQEMAMALADGTDRGAALLVGTALVIGGLGFKVAAVPFHMWAPDVYEGAPLPTTAFLSAAAKAATFALFLRLFVVAFAPSIETWQLVLAGMAALTMTLGNLVALSQHNIKRLMAYSSIGQAGYMLMGIVALSTLAASGLAFHLVGYALSTLAAFLGIILYFNLTGKEEIADYAGLAERSPFLAMTLMAAFFSLAGLPFFVGFATKFYLFAAVAAQGFLWLVALAVLNSVVSLYYYLQIVRQMYIEPIRPGDDTSPLRLPRVSAILLAVLTVAIIVVGIYPGPVAQGALDAVGVIF